MLTILKRNWIRVSGVVASSDRPGKDDLGILKELFADKIQEFNQEHGVECFISSLY